MTRIAIQCIRSFACAATVVWAISPCAAQQPPEQTTRASVAREIRQLVEQLQSAREQARREEAAHRDRVDALQRQVDSLGEQVERQEAAVQQQQTETARLEARIAADTDRATHAKTRLQSVANAAIPVARQIHQRIDNSPAEQRLRRVTAIKEAISMLEDKARPAAQSEGIKALLAIMGEEWIASRSVVLANEPVILEGGEHLEHAWVLKFGLATKILVSEDGDTVGLWSGDAQQPWQLDLPAAAKDQIRSLMAVVREKSPPAVLSTPVLVKPASEH